MHLRFLPITIMRASKLTAVLLVSFWAMGTVNCSCQSLEIRRSEHRASGSYGSVAVVVIRDDSIVVAADSRTLTDGMVNPDTTCKITVVKDVVFAATGLLKGNRYALGIVDYARSVLTGPSKIWYKLKTFQSGASKLLTSWMDIPEDRDSLADSPYYRNNNSVHSIFCFFSDGKAVVVEYSFTPSLVGNRFKIGGVYDAGARKPGEILWIGASEQTDTLLMKDKEFSERIHALDAVSAGRALVEKQTEFTPGIVGGNVDIVLLTPKGAKWIQHKQNCY
jgi:hypothetical protein